MTKTDTFIGRAAVVTCIFVVFGWLAGCTKETKPIPPTNVVITGCEHFHLITASPADTVPTKVQILAHNAEYLKACKASK